MFAIYMQYVTSALQRGNIHNRDEPCMLLYADDMVLWAETEGLFLSKVLFLTVFLVTEDTGSGRNKKLKRKNW